MDWRKILGTNNKQANLVFIKFWQVQDNIAAFLKVDVQ